MGLPNRGAILQSGGTIAEGARRMVRGCPWFGLVLIVAYVLAFVLGPVDRGGTPGRALAGPPGRAEPATGRLVGQAPGPDSAGAPAGARPVAPPAQIAPFPPLPPCEPVRLLPAPPLDMPAPSASEAAPAGSSGWLTGRLCGATVCGRIQPIQRARLRAASSSALTPTSPCWPSAPS